MEPCSVSLAVAPCLCRSGAVHGLHVARPLGECQGGRRAGGVRAYLRRLAQDLAGVVFALTMPFILYGGYGVWLGTRTLSGVLGSTSPSGRHSLRRLTGLVTLVFVAIRLSRFWRPVLTQSSSPRDVRIEWLELASSTWNGMPLLAYAWLLALTAVAVHLGHGFVLAAGSGGLLPTRRRRLVATIFGAIFGIFSFGLGAHGTLLLATGWSPFSSVEPETLGACTLVPDANP